MTKLPSIDDVKGKRTGRAAWKCSRCMAVMSERQVDAVRSITQRFGVPAPDLAAAIGVSESAVRRIVNGTQWQTTN